MKLRQTLLLALAALVLSTTARGGEYSQVETRESDHRFAAGSWELEDLVGSFFLFDRRGNERPSVDFLLNSTRVGIMIINPKFTGLLRGNVEFMVEAFGGSIFYGPGDVVFGGTAFFRYNFIQPGARIVPYFQVGAGGVYTDIPEGPIAGNAVSQSVNFNLQGILGLRYLLNSKWAINAETSYRHISNASMSKPNYGIDQFGGALGLGYSF